MTDDNDAPESRVKIDDLSEPQQELNAEEMDQVRGGDYVQGLYRDLLGRTPGGANVNSVPGVSGGGYTGDKSAGDTSRGDAVKDLYNDLLNRPKP